MIAVGVVIGIIAILVIGLVVAFLLADTVETRGDGHSGPPDDAMSPRGPIRW